MSIQNYIQDGSTLAAAAAVQGTAVPALTKRLLRAVSICNPTASAVAASVYLVPANGAPDATNVFISKRTIAPDETYPCPELVNQGLNAGGAVYALGLGLVFKHTATDFT